MLSKVICVEGLETKKKTMLILLHKT
jgi:hypothetical protein